MRYALPTLVLLTASVTNALPVSRRQIRIDAEATREAHQRDNGATRAATGIEIKTPSGNCLSIVDQSGDFRKNLQVVEEASCDGSELQKWDIITRGIHNDRAGAALIVSTSVSSCLNFDPRRRAGNQVVTFSCGGRADGGGRVTDSQLFEFDGSTTSIPLAPLNGRGAVCFSIVGGNLDQSACTSSNPAANQVFSLGNAAPAPAPPAAAPADPVDEDEEEVDPPTASVPPAAPPAAIPTGSIRLDLEATAEAHRRDNGATRAFANVPIKDASGNCLTVNLDSGDFRQNLMKVISAPCTGATTQQWDFITRGIHNDVAGTTLIVSSALNNCLNFDGRRQPGDRAILFSCGGRADGDGRVTDSQLFPFTDPTATSLTLAPQNERGAVCLAVNNGILDQTTCNNSEVFTIGDATSSAPQPPADEVDDEPEIAEPTTTEVDDAPEATPAPPTNNTPSVGTVRLDEAATAEAHQRDGSATRAFTAAPIKVNGQCLQANLNTGDFRANLMEVAVVDCVDGLDVQQWDIITAGRHNNVAGQTLVVSSRTNACLNFDDRRQPGNKVLLFSCGGRADGGGETTNSQLFAFNGDATSIPLVPGNVQNAKCITANGGKLDIADCNPASPNAAQTFTIG